MTGFFVYFKQKSQPKSSNKLVPNGALEEKFTKGKKQQLIFDDFFLKI